MRDGRKRREEAAHLQSVGGAVVVVRGGDEPARHDALAQDLAWAVDVGEEHLERLDPLDDALLDAVPLLGADDARHEVERQGPLPSRQT